MTSDVAARVAAERVAQGLGVYVEDEPLVNLVAALLAEHNDAPGTRVPGRRDHPAAAKTKEGRSHATP